LQVRFNVDSADGFAVENDVAELDEAVRFEPGGLLLGKGRHKIGISPA
jgi:hypothetical protein